MRGKLLQESFRALDRDTFNGEDEVAAAGELLPLPCDGIEYALTNVLNVLDCLDARRSVIYPYMKTYVFYPEILRTTVSSIFKVP